jgi:hypothetical protein
LVNYVRKHCFRGLSGFLAQIYNVNLLITNVPAGITDVNGGSVNPNDTLYYDFVVTNTGNATSNLSIPFAAIAGTNVTVTGYQIDLNNDGDFTDAGESTTPLTTDITVSNIAADGQVKVRVTATVNAGLSAGTSVGIQLGNTAPNDNSAATQNQPFSNDTSPDDVSAPGTSPVNGTREAAATQTTTVASAVIPLALALVEKTLTTYTPGNTSLFNDDTIVYRLDLTVQNISPNSGFTPANLEGTLPETSVTGATSPAADDKFILVSDNIPANSVFDSTFTPVTPTGWTVIYSTSTTTTPLNDTTWTTTQPAAASIAKIGWVYTGGTTGVLAAGTTTTGGNGFQFRVQSTLTAAGQINNIAQVFGETVGDTTNETVYDESGDQNPNNFNDDNSPPDASGTNYANDNNDPIDRGEADPSTQGTDTNNDNSGTGSEGEVNVQAITAAGILNGPDGTPAAVGPTDNNDDFQNQATLTQGGSPVTPTRTGTTFDPDAITFNNTFSNSVSSAGELDTVRLLLLPPNDGNIPAESRQAAASDLPTGTTATISVSNGSTVTYTYDGTAWTFTSGSGSSFDGTANTLKFDNVQPGNQIDYTVVVNLPNTTNFSEYRFDQANPGEGINQASFNIPIVAFVDNNNNGAFDTANDNIYNITIDRIYTGYIILLKEVRIIDTDGTTVLDGYATTINNSLVIPGRILEYRISYLNFSFTPTNSGSASAGSASGNTTLDASSLVITENGSASPNNWAGLTTHLVGTTFTTGSIEYFNTGISLGSTDPSTGTSVTSYVNTVGTVTPTTSSTSDPDSQANYQGNMTFRRTIN